MPPERLPWDRKDLRKYDRSTSRWRESSSSHYGSKYDRSAPRWRESSSVHYGSYRDFSRWGGSNEFRRPTGNGKQGGWQMFAEESGHGYAPFRSGDKMLDDKNFRPTFTRGDGKYGRNSRDRAAFGHRDWRAHSWDMSDGSPNTLGRLHDVSNDQRSVDDMLTYPTSHSQPDFSSAWDDHQSKEQHDNYKLDCVSVLGAGQRGDRETSLDWKPLKWARSISLSSQGSGFSNSSSSKSLGGADSIAGKTELHVKNAPLVTSLSGEAATCVTSALSEEMSARKKPRLNWGEGLAKYEKKKVEGPEVNLNKDGPVISCSNHDAIHSECLNVDKSPRVLELSECASPATPSSVACSSPGLEEKSFGKTINANNDAINLCGSPSAGSQSHTESFAFNLEALDGTSITNLLVELLQYDDSSMDSSFVRSTVMNKLLILKGNILKTLEVTESEIDSLENELKSLNFESGRCPCPAVSSSFPVDVDTELCSEQVVPSNNIPRPSHLQVLSFRAEHMEEVPLCNNVLEEVHCGVKDEDADSPGTATSKFVEPVSVVKTVCFPSDPVKFDECSGDTNVFHSPIVVSKSFMPCTNEEGSDTSACRDINMLIESKEGASISSDLSYAEDNLCNMILIANKKSASRASKVFNYLLPRDQFKIDCSEISNVALLKNDTTIREKFVWRKRLTNFKERVLALKFKTFHHLWKEDMRLLTIRKNRAKSQKKYESSMRTTQCVFQKNRSSIRLRHSSSPAGNLNLVPTTEMLNITSKLLSESQVKRYRNDLKMPAMILDKKERRNSQFISSNGLVEDPWAAEKERYMINPWTSEEREIFIDKLNTFGKDFQKIASFLDHKTTADCVEFYYKNHKSDCFEKTKKRKQVKSSSNYLVASGKNWKREMNASGVASFIAADAINVMEKHQMQAGSVCLAGYFDSKMSRHDDGKLDQSSNFNVLEIERETVAADILAGICGTISSEAMSSCITTLDPGEGCRDVKSQKANSVKKLDSISDVSQSVDEETCSDDSCGEMDSSDWTDEEKSIFVQAVSSYGKDFTMISQCVRTRSRDQCKVFFSKARKCLALDAIQTGHGNSDEANEGGSDTEDGFSLEASSVMCSDKSGSKTAGDLHLPVSVTKIAESGAVNRKTLTSDLNRSQDCNVAGLPDHEESKDEKTFVTDSRLTVNKLNSPFDCGSKIINGFSHQSEFVQAQEISNESVSSEVEREKSTEDISTGLAIPVSEVVGSSSSSSVAVQVQVEVSADGSGDSLEGKALEEPHSSSGIGVESINLLTVQQSTVVPSLLEAKLTADSVLHSSSAFPCDKMHIQKGVSSQLGGLKNGDVGKQSVCANDHIRLLSAQSLTKCDNTSQILEGERYGGTSGPVSEVTSHSVSERNVTNQFFSQECYLQKCNKSKVQCSVPELPLLSQHSDKQLNGHSCILSDLAKPCSNGDVKLFGKILSKPSSSPMPNRLENVERGLHCVQPVSNSLNMKVTGHKTLGGSSSVLKFDHNNFLALENVPVKSYGFWDGNKIQTGFSSIPDYFLSKYPEAFGNYQSSSEMKQQTLLGAVAVKCSDPNSSNVSILSAGEVSGSNGFMDYQMCMGVDSNKVQPYPVEVRQRQDTFSEIQRNGLDAIPIFQQQGRGMAATNVVERGGGILVGGSCTDVADPVAALKMHYEKMEQYGGQNGSINGEEESWGSRGDIGR